MERRAGARITNRARAAALGALKRCGERVAAQLRASQKIDKGVEEEERDERGRWTTGGDKSLESVWAGSMGATRVDLPVKSGVKSENPKSGFGLCTQLSMDQNGKTGADVYVGYAVPKVSWGQSERDYEKTGSDYVVGAFPHSWNVENGMIVDRALGSHSASKYIYFGMKVPQDVIDTTTPDGLASWHTKQMRLALDKRFAKAYPRPSDPDFDPDPPSIDPPDPVDAAALESAAFDLTGLSELEEGEFADALAEAVGDAALELLGEVGLAGDTELVNQVSEAAVAAAREQAAELVSQIDETTRNMIRGVIADGLEENIGLDGIIDNLASSAAFSGDRAELIAQTEVRDANEMGVLQGLGAAADAGVNVKKEWLLGPNPCPVCIENADAGPIDLDEPFPSGDMAPTAHPRCVCAITGVVEEDEVEQLAKGVEDEPRDDRGHWTTGGVDRINGAVGRISAAAKTRVSDFVSSPGVRAIIDRVVAGLRDPEVAKSALSRAVVFAMYHGMQVDMPSDIEERVRHEVETLADNARVTTAKARGMLRRVVDELVRVRQDEGRAR